MKSQEQIKEKIEECRKAIVLQHNLRETCPKGTKDYYNIDDMIQRNYRDILTLNWVLDEKTD